MTIEKTYTNPRGEKRRIKITYTNNTMVLEFETNEERDRIIDIFYNEKIVDVEDIRTFTDEDNKKYHYTRYGGIDHSKDKEVK